MKSGLRSSMSQEAKGQQTN